MILNQSSDPVSNLDIPNKDKMSSSNPIQHLQEIPISVFNHIEMLS